MTTPVSNRPRRRLDGAVPHALATAVCVGVSLVGAMATGCASSGTVHERVHEPEVAQLIRGSGLVRLWFFDPASIGSSDSKTFEIDVHAAGSGVRVGRSTILSSAHIVGGTRDASGSDACFVDATLIEDFAITSGWPDGAPPTDAHALAHDRDRSVDSQVREALDDWALVRIRTPGARSMRDPTFVPEHASNLERPIPRPRGVLALPVRTSAPELGARVEVLGYPGGRLPGAARGRVGPGPGDDAAIDLGDNGAFWIEIDPATLSFDPLPRGISGGLVVLCHDHADGTTTYEAAGIAAAGRITWSLFGGRRQWLLATRFPPEALEVIAR